MTASREKGLLQLLTCFQVLLVLLLFWGCAFLLLGFLYGEDAFARAYVKYAVVIGVALIFEATSRPTHLRPVPGRARHQAGDIARRQIMFIVIAITTLLVYSRDQRLSRAFFGIFCVSTYSLLHLTNHYSPGWLNRAGMKYFSHWRLRTLVLGPQAWCDVILKDIQSISSVVDVRRVEYTDAPQHPAANYVDLVTKSPIDLLVLPPDGIPDAAVIDMLRLGDRHGFRCWMPITLTHSFGRHFDLQRIGCLDVLTPPTEPLENTFNQMLKRVFDLCFSLPIALVILPPLCLLVWLIHRFQSPGPLFFRQERVGKNGKLFHVIKFRTLHVRNADEAQQVSKNDSRVFKGGGILRRLSLDEMPQFLNVLQGDMSVVGPRPHMEAHDAKFREIFERYGVRRYVKPGLTGLAQVKGYRGEITKPLDLRHRARLDNFYVANWSLPMDLWIILRTVWTIFAPPKSAY